MRRKLLPGDKVCRIDDPRHVGRIIQRFKWKRKGYGWTANVQWEEHGILEYVPLSQLMHYEEEKDMTKNYKFEIKGTARNGQTWTTKGFLIGCEFADAFTLAMKRTFQDITHGKAIYGKPETTCQGPYDVLAVHIEQMVDVHTLPFEYGVKQ